MIVVCSFLLVNGTSRMACFRGDYFENGDIIISNSLDLDFGTASISIYTEDNELLYAYNIESNDVLKAKEERIDLYENSNNEIVAMTKDISSEMLHWKDKFSLKS